MEGPSSPCRPETSTCRFACTPRTQHGTRRRQPHRIRAVICDWSSEVRSEISEMRELEEKLKSDARTQAVIRLQRAQRARVIHELGELVRLAERLLSALLIQRHAREYCADVAKKHAWDRSVLRVQCAVRRRLAIQGVLWSDAAAHLASPSTPAQLTIFVLVPCIVLHRRQAYRSIHEDMHRFIVVRLKRICAPFTRVSPIQLIRNENESIARLAQPLPPFLWKS
eukprot:scaffold274812_cov41-Tisochrysis_lutea.AAC.1